MKIDSAIQTFTEKYDRVAMESIDELSNDLGLCANRSTIKGFNIQEAFDRFSEYLKGYGEYKIENKENSKASPQDVIRENVANFIDNHVFECADIPYSRVNEFVRTYLEGIESLISTIDTVKNDMIVEDVDLEAVGDVNDFADHFMGKLQECFDPVIDKILWASGYNAHQRMMKTGSASREGVLPTPTFL